MSGRLSETEVRQRLDKCSDESILKELYDFGLILTKEGAEQVKAIESKATSIAAYGTAVSTILVSSTQIWAHLGNRSSLWIGFFAGLCGLMCTYYSVRVLKLQQFETFSEDEWLKEECLGGIETLRRYRVLIMWGYIDSHLLAQSAKVRLLQQAEVWLTGAVAYLVFLLFQIAATVNFNNDFWIAGRKLTENPLWISCWQHFAAGTNSLLGVGSVLTCGLGFLWLFRRSRKA